MPIAVSIRLAPKDETDIALNRLLFKINTASVKNVFLANSVTTVHEMGFVGILLMVWFDNILLKCAQKYLYMSFKTGR